MYKSLVRSHLEYANCIWSPYTMNDRKKLEKVQMRATKLISEIKNLSYIDRLKYLNLPTLQYRRCRGDMIMVFKLLSGVYDSNIACHFILNSNLVTRGHHLRYLKDTYIMIYVNIILVTVLYQSGIVCLIILLILNLLVFSKKIRSILEKPRLLF